MGVLFTNNASTTLSAAISSTSATSISVASSSTFPAPGAGEYFYATIDDGSNIEIVKVTAVSGTTWTVVRGSDNTTAATFANGTTVQLRAAAALLTDIQQNIAAKSANQTVYNATTASSATSYDVGTNPQNENNAMVFLDGVMQHHDTFSFSGSTLTFDAAPSNGLKLEVIIDNLINLQSSNLTVDTFTATNGQTAFTLSDTPAAEDNLIVFIEGVFQNQDSYTISNNVLTMSAGVTTGRKVVVYVINPVNIGTPSDGTVTSAKLSGNITMPGTLTVGSNDVAFDSPTFVVDNANSRVGLGTASPSVPVDIVGDVKMSSTLDLTSHLDMPDNAKIKLGTGDDLEIYHDGSHNYIDAVTGDQDIIFKGTDSSSDITALTLDMSDLGSAKFNGPNLNITADDARLLVEEADGTNIGWFGDITGGGVGGCFLYNHGGTATVQIRADATAGFINNGANFGIGTDSPARNLVVSSSGQTDVAIVAGTTSSAQLQFGDSGDDNIGQIEYNNSENSMSFFTNATERVFINSSGNVGIGTTSVNGRLHSEDSTAGNWVGYFNNTGTGGAGVLIKSAGATGSENLLDVRNGDGTVFKIAQSSGDVTLSGNLSMTSNVIYASQIYVNDRVGHRDDASTFIDFDTDTIKFATDGEAMRIDSNKNIGFGTTTLPTGMGSSSYKQFKIGGGILADSGHSSGHNIMLGNNVYVGASNDLKFTHAAAASVINMTSGDINFRTHDGGGASADATASLTSRFYIKENGNIGVGTTSPSAPFHIAGGNPNSTADSVFHVSKTGANDFTCWLGSGADDYGLGIRGVGNYAFAVYDHNAGAYRARLQFGGDLYLQNTTVNSISDRRLKKNIVDANSQWNDIKALRWRNFEWKEEHLDGTYLGLIADEVEAVSPNLVEINAQPKEDIDAGIEDPEHKAVKYSIVWMKAMKALQEAQERIETLEAKVQALESS